MLEIQTTRKPASNEMMFIMHVTKGSVTIQEMLGETIYMDG